MFLKAPSTPTLVEISQPPRTLRARCGSHLAAAVAAPELVRARQHMRRDSVGRRPGGELRRGEALADVAVALAAPRHELLTVEPQPEVVHHLLQLQLGLLKGGLTQPRVFACVKQPETAVITTPPVPVGMYRQVRTRA